MLIEGGRWRRGLNKIEGGERNRKFVWRRGGRKRKREFDWQEFRDRVKTDREDNNKIDKNRLGGLNLKEKDRKKLEKMMSKEECAKMSKEERMMRGGKGKLKIKIKEKS